MPQKQTDIVAFTDLKPKLRNAEPLINLQNTEFVIEGYELEERQLGDRKAQIAYVKVNGKEYYTFSQVLIDQLNIMKPVLDQGKKIKATLKRQKNYYYFT
jgi:hypothetical protein